MTRARAPPRARTARTGTSRVLTFIGSTRPGKLTPTMRRPLRTSRTRRAGFILFFGTRTISRSESAPPVQARCLSCQREVGLVAMSFRDWFTLFFIPVFPISGRTPYCQCPNCGAQFPGAADDLWH